MTTTLSTTTTTTAARLRRIDRRAAATIGGIGAASLIAAVLGLWVGRAQPWSPLLAGWLVSALAVAATVILTVATLTVALVGRRGGAR